MVHPVTTTDILLQEVAGLLTEIRDLLQERPVTAQQQKKPAAASPAAGKPKQTRARTTSTKKA